MRTQTPRESTVINETSDLKRRRKEKKSRNIQTLHYLEGKM